MDSSTGTILGFGTNIDDKYKKFIKRRFRCQVVNCCTKQYVHDIALVEGMMKWNDMYLLKCYRDKAEYSRRTLSRIIL